jgi:hypothetical protein
MIRNKFWIGVSNVLSTATVMVIVTLVSASGARAATYKVLHVFKK